MKNGNTPASPTVYMDQTNGNGEMYCSQEGLTKREHFAGLAMQGLLNAKYNQNIHLGFIATEAVSIADALLEELAK